MKRMNTPTRADAPKPPDMFPHTVTLYETETTIDSKYHETTVNHITVLEGVLWIDSKAANVRATGLEGADAIDLQIPFNVKAYDGETGAGKRYADPIEYWKSDKSELWTIAIGTVCVKGKVVEPKATRAQLELAYDNVVQATKVDKIDFGSPGMMHFEVGCN